MPTNVVVTVPAFTAAIPTPDDAEGATGAGLDGMVQPLLNNDAFLYALTASTGVKIVRSVGSLAALKALATMTHGELCVMYDATIGIHLFFYHSTATTPGTDTLVVEPGSGVGRWFSCVTSGVGSANGLALYNASGKLALGKVTNHIYEAAATALGSSVNNTTTTYATALTATSGVTTAAGDKVIIHCHGTYSAASGAGSCFGRLTVSENGGADIALTETEDTFDDTTLHRRSYHTVRTVVTGGTFAVRWQIKTGAGGVAATLATPAAITIQVIRP